MKGEKTMVVVPWFSDTPPYAEDTLNSNRNRNINNTGKMDYNCGGYALGTFNWYLPFLPEQERYIAHDTWEEAMKLTEMCVQTMQIEFKSRNLRTIESLRELREEEYAFAFRISTDGDFHYVRRHTNGRWFHKCGADSHIRSMTIDEVFSDEWIGRYNGPLVLFAIHR